jgi:uncharacterized protein YfaS (alpha-2-macroglobulin family)
MPPLPFFAAAALLVAQTTGHITVHVVDSKTGKPSVGWTVQVTTRDGDVQQITDRSGTANFLAVSVGIARIDVLREGKLAVCPAVVDVSPDESAVVNVHAAKGKGAANCVPARAETHVRPGVTSDVYDIF